MIKDYGIQGYPNLLFNLLIGTEKKVSGVIIFYISFQEFFSVYTFPKLLKCMKEITLFISKGENVFATGN